MELNLKVGTLTAAFGFVKLETETLNRQWFTPFRLL